MTMICQFCRKRVFQTRNGAWYHKHNSSVSCRPGEGSDRRATPIAVRGVQDWRGGRNTPRGVPGGPVGNVPGSAGVVGSPARMTGMYRARPS